MGARIQLENSDFRSHRDHIPLGAVGRDKHPCYGRGHLDRRLVGHHIDQGLVLSHVVAGFDVPGDDLGLGDAFAHIGQFEDETRHGFRPPLHGAWPRRPAWVQENSSTRKRADRACPTR